MLRSLARPIWSLVLIPFLCAASDPVIVQDRVIAGGPNDSLEVRHLVLRGTNEQIGRALAELAKERYGARLEPAPDPLKARALRQFLERNDPILLERMKGVAAAFGKSIEDDAWDFSALGFTELRAGCSVAHLPPTSTANGKSVVSRDYDFTTGALSFGFLSPGMLHPTARPYLLELHPDQGYASIAMVAYDLLSGVLDGINSEGLTVTLAMDDTLFSANKIEPTREAAVGLGELQTLRMLLDTCATVAEAKQALLASKQYYRYVPVHYLIADRAGDAFVWEYSEYHNKESFIDGGGDPLVMTNFTLHDYLEDGRAPSAEKAKPVCRRYAYLREKLANEKLDDDLIRGFHKNVDAQMSQAAEPSRPPERTLWHAFYYPEDRRVRLSYYLGEEPWPGQERLVRQIRSDYLEFRLEPTNNASGKTKTAASNAAAMEPSVQSSSAPPEETHLAPEQAGVRAAIENAGGSFELLEGRVVGVSLDKATRVDSVVPLLGQIEALEKLNLGNPQTTDADVRALQGLPKLHTLGLMSAPVDDESLAIMQTLPALRVLNLIGTKVTDAGLAHLQGIATLEYLGLKGTAVSDGGLVHLKDLTGLRTLNLADTRVTDAGLAHLAGLSALEGLNLSNDLVTDAGLGQVARMTGIAGLNLSGTKVTDAGLVHLKLLPKLTKLNLTGTAVTDQGIADAKEFLPAWIQVTR
jgi:Acyl-coenzyme A:6-aminopenicillanic acid acyl-transferase